jgi:hypothetical protein
VLIVLVLEASQRKKHNDECNVHHRGFRTCTTKEYQDNVLVLQATQRKKNHNAKRHACHGGFRVCNTNKEPGRQTQLIVLVLQAEQYKKKP